ncbi:MAG: DmsE family decaheme c-type cytochrome [Methylobacter sp.]|uniref:DmsE family decaheme c-type cytochrome n=1 Tax=Methylobacter sp. TaxID=2051955 RepID=UPI0025856216|nr:DmsE family decaheme c-type cytochrome [Methylobacter sp.]MCL7421489.1 DmsE family decaheme c-type cytochrome [Methylobacter sp.]
MQRRIPRLIVLLLYGLFALEALAEDSQQPVGELEQAAPSDCLSCHKEPKITAIFSTPHAQKGDPRMPFAHQACDTCHGVNRPHPKIAFGAKAETPADEQNQVCLGCHERGDRIHWQGSPHQSSDLACASCHTVHAVHDPILDKTSQTNVCFSCHAEQKAQSYLRSRHPFREAKMVCSDCHNPHGSTNEFLLTENTVNETCFNCHTEKRGPYLWEHPPVQENCALCHNPHGSTQDRLLKVRTPYLCQQCHSEAFHPGTLYDGGGVPPAGAQSRLLAEGCLNCHYAIHGSNHPAGAAFDR